ncbi:aldose epimerase family protein [Nitratireductor sp. CH_MIT9313-5]|uniref:aldose epimerase family protein n=1 Tax=Nitratireductor sp. CH_MIT9313-5 TaxID=3107764 RepID=UPI0030091FDC
MAVEISRFAEHEGKDVLQAVIESESGTRICVLSYGALIRDWQVRVAGGLRSVVLGFEEFEHYPAHSRYFGAIAGRVANRIAGGRFTLNGREYQLDQNQGDNHLHGGSAGIGKQIWLMEPLAENGVRLNYTSLDGEMGYPGSLDIAVEYRLDGNRLRIEFEAMASEATPVNLVQHNYFNLMGEGDVLDHRLFLRANAYTPVDETLIPTGEIIPVSGTQFDFRNSRVMRDAAGIPQEFDHNLVLDTGRTAEDPAVILVAPDDSLTLKLFTDQPGLQLYNGSKLDVPVPGLNGVRYGRHAGLCLEDQKFPDAVNNPHFPNTIVTPDAPYRHWCEIEIA